MVDVGSNDLDLTRNPNINISQLARELVTQAQEIGLHFDLKVLICLSVPRAESKFPGLFEITMAFNDQIKTMAREKTNVKVRVQKGLFKKDSRYLDRHGVHLNFRKTKKYLHSVQAAVMLLAFDNKKKESHGK